MSDKDETFSGRWMTDGMFLVKFFFALVDSLMVITTVTVLRNAWSATLDKFIGVSIQNSMDYKLGVFPCIEGTNLVYNKYSNMMGYG